MSTNSPVSSATVFTADSIRARAKVLARGDYAMRADLVRLRREAGLTQKQVAERMGVTQQAVHKLERYDADPKISTIRRYANAVGALVEHRVIPDLGQSILLASTPPWESVRTATTVVPIRRTVTRSPEVGDAWSDVHRVNLALVS